MGKSYESRRSLERIDARTNVRVAPHVHHRRPNGCADRGPHWYKHLLGQWAEVVGVGDRDWALMRAQTCAHHHLSRISAKRLDPSSPKLVHTLIGTMGTSYGSR
jgi:hypothetical protein